MEFEGEVYWTIIEDHPVLRRDVFQGRGRYHVDALRDFAEQALHELLQWKDSCQQWQVAHQGLADSLVSAESLINELNKEMEANSERNDDLQATIEELEREAVIDKQQLDYLSFALDKEVEIVLKLHAELREFREHRNCKKEKALEYSLEICVLKESITELEEAQKEQVPRLDQAAQTMVEPTFAVETQTSVEVCDSGCQTFGDRGCQHECCEKEVQTAFSFTKLASVVCWRCGCYGHYHSQCWSKGRKRCFACKKGGAYPAVLLFQSESGPKPESRWLWEC